MIVYSYTPLLVFSVVIAAVLGAVSGSFLNCAGWRIAHGESFVKGKSRCPSCSHELGALDLIPVFSYVFLGGKCRYCKKKISPRYLFAELIMAALAVMCVLFFDLSFLCLRNFLFISCLFCLSVADLEAFIIPNGTLIAAVAVWLAWLPFSGYGWAEIGLHVLSAAVYGAGVLVLSLIMDKLLKKESLGGGDVKLFFVMGLYLGLVASLFSVMLSCVIGLLFVLFARKKAGEHFPFGPSIAAATTVMLFCGDLLTNAYLGLFGG